MSRNIVLLVLDTVRKDTFTDIASELCGMADTSYETCYAASHYTLPSHASMFSGQLPHQHGVHCYSPDYGSLPVDETFMNDLDTHETIGISANGGFLSSETGFGKYFDSFVYFNGDSVRYPSGVDPSAFHEACNSDGLAKIRAYFQEAWQTDSTLPSLGNAVVTKLRDITLNRPVPRLTDYGTETALKTAMDRTQDASEPFFLFANLIDAHGPFESVLGWESDAPASWTSRNENTWDIANADMPNSEYAEYLHWYRELYRASISYLDKKVAAFVRALNKLTDRETTVIITADHGDELALSEGERFGHRDLTTSVLHVPLLVINGPNLVEHRPVSHLELGRLITSLVIGGDIPDITRERVPAEKLGHIKTPDENTAFWGRACRVVYEDGVMFKWDTLGSHAQYEVSSSSESLMASGIEIPDRVRTAFDEELEIYAGETAATTPKGQVRGRLKDLGYL